MPKYNFCITRLGGLIAAAILFTGTAPLYGFEISRLIQLPALAMVLLWPTLVILAFYTSKAPKFFLACIYSLYSTPAEPDADVESLAGKAKWVIFAAGMIHLLFSIILLLRDMRGLPIIGHAIAIGTIGLLYAIVAMLFMYLVQFSHRAK